MGHNSEWDTETCLYPVLCVSISCPLLSEVLSQKFRNSLPFLFCAYSFKVNGISLFFLHAYFIFHILILLYGLIENGLLNILKKYKIKIYKTIILPVVLYGCQTWSLTSRKESRLRIFENRILRRIFDPKRDDNGEWRRLHNEELQEGDF